MLNLNQVLLIIKARLLAFIITFVIVFGLVVGITLMLPKEYKATTSVVLNYKGVDPVTGFAIPSSLMSSYMTTQMGVMNSHRVALKVVDKLGIAKSPVIQESFQAATEGKGDIRDWAANFIARNLKTSPSPESNIIDLSYTSKDPEFSKLVADAFASVYIDTNIELSNQPSQQASAFLDEQKVILRNQLLEAQTKLAKYQEDNGITSAVENADIENLKLNELTSQLAVVQSQALEASKRNRVASSSASSPDVLANPLIQNLKMQISQANTKFAEMSKQYSKNHPSYQAAQAELANLRAELRKETARVQSSMKNTASIYQQRERELKAEVAAQKEKLLKLNRSRDQLSVLQNEVASAKAAYENISTRSSQTHIEGRTDQSDVIILNPAVLPTSPSSPKVVMNIFFGFFAAIFLGFLVVFIKETLNRKVRCIKDIEDAIDLPVVMLIGRSKKPTLNLVNKFMPSLLTSK